MKYTKKSIFVLLNLTALLLYQIAITLIPGIGDINGKKLIQHCGSAEAVFREKKKNLLRIHGIGRASAEAIVNQNVLSIAEEEIRFIEKHGIKTFYFKDKEYPYRLKDCIDSPVMLYYLGETDLNHEKVVGIVGTRRATDYGRKATARILEGLVPTGALIVSGLAYGIDSQAHRQALKNDLPTVGVLAHGLDRIYPPQNKTLARKMTRRGGLLSDFISNTNPDRENFPKRNRIIAGLCDALIVIESAMTGGALITANIAGSYNRDVFAVPGRVEDRWSKGCNYLIRSNKAALVQDAEDIKYMMGWDEQTEATRSVQTKLFEELEPEEEAIFSIIRERGDTGIDDIVDLSGLTATKAAAILLSLEFKGMVKCLPGKIFKAAYG